MLKRLNQFTILLVVFMTVGLIGSVSQVSATGTYENEIVGNAIITNENSTIVVVFISGNATNVSIDVGTLIQACELDNETAAFGDEAWIANFNMTGITNYSIIIDGVLRSEVVVSDVVENTNENENDIDNENENTNENENSNEVIINFSSILGSLSEGYIYLVICAAVGFLVLVALGVADLAGHRYGRY